MLKHGSQSLEQINTLLCNVSYKEMEIVRVCIDKHHRVLP